MSLNYFDFSLAYGQVRTVEVYGSYVHYIEGDAAGEDDTIEVRSETGSDLIILKPGQSFNLGHGREFVRWSVRKLTQNGTVTGTLVMGFGRFDDSRIAGEVSVYDIGRSRSTNFLAKTVYGTQAALAGNYSYLSMMNTQAAGGKLIALRQFAMTGSTAGTIQLRRHDVDIGATIFTPVYKRHEPALFNFNLNGRMKGGTIAAPPGTMFQEWKITTNTQYQVRLDEPLILMPGAGIVFINSVVNADLSVLVEFSEESQ